MAVPGRPARQVAEICDQILLEQFLADLEDNTQRWVQCYFQNRPSRPFSWQRTLIQHRGSSAETKAPGELGPIMPKRRSTKLKERAVRLRGEIP